MSSRGGVGFLRKLTQQREGAIGGDAEAFHQDAFGLTDVIAGVQGAA